ncbi:MAG: hypothetical protein CL912_09445 [Deltaproteobacteria bacterium]|nr:hypothetical protein [Deltaproteobacteria bacterium]|tara:strand:+ start:292 stop:483 length:192 start_codon:yes stop_codon:yes gene_type:complete
MPQLMTHEHQTAPFHISKFFQTAPNPNQLPAFAAFNTIPLKPEKQKASHDSETERNIHIRHPS